MDFSQFVLRLIAKGKHIRRCGCNQVAFFFPPREKSTDVCVKNEQIGLFCELSMLTGLAEVLISATALFQGNREICNDSQ
ncbi:MAG: hypothetical protein ACI8R4_001432 [Paracoccaceae bacterium]